MSEKLLNYDEAAKLLGVKKKTLYGYVHRHVVPYFKSSNGRVYFDASELLEWMRYSHHDANDVVESRAAIAEVEAAVV